MAAALEKQLLIEQLVNSKNFATTHSTIAKLSAYTNFSVDEAEEMLSASIENSQIRWIATDTDVKTFIQSLAFANYEKINGELAEKAIALTQEDEVPEYSDSDLEDPPF
jgi:hypothetical protein